MNNIISLKHVAFNSIVIIVIIILILCRLRPLCYTLWRVFFTFCPLRATIIAFVCVKRCRDERGLTNILLTNRPIHNIIMISYCFMYFLFLIYIYICIFTRIVYREHRITYEDKSWPIQTIPKLLDTILRLACILLL
jgi:hypothetical protein